MTKLHVPPEPCLSCPYRKEHPSGVWSADEYEKMRGFDGYPGIIASFHCHQENQTKVPTACRGWLTVHSESLAVRIAAAVWGCFTDEEIYAPVQAELHESGTAAADAGLARIERPDRRAKVMTKKLLRRGVGTNPE